MNKDNYKKVVDIMDKIAENHVNIYFKYDKNDVEAIINDCIDKYGIENLYDVVYVVRCILAKILSPIDSHTRVRFKNKFDFPIKFKIDNHKIYVRAVKKNYEKYLNMQLKKVNGIDVYDIADCFKQSVCYSTNGYFESQFENILSSNEVKIMPIIKNKKRIEFELCDINGEKYIVSFKLNKNYKINYYQELLKDNFKYNIKNSTLIIKYNDCNLPINNKNIVNELIENIKVDVKDKIIDQVIIDFRDNTGGSALTFNKIEEYLKTLNCKVYGIINKYNFSAVRFNILDLQQNFAATLIGEDIGTQINAFGQCKKIDYSLKGIERLEITCSTKFFFLNDSGKMRCCSTKELINKLYETEPDKFCNSKYIHPDIYMTDREINEKIYYQ